MKFDIVIGNPPYNDNNTSRTINKTTMDNTTVLNKWIKYISNQIKQNGIILIISTPGIGRKIEKHGLHIHKLTFIPDKTWIKKISAVWWVLGKLSKPTFIHNKTINKMMKINHTPKSGQSCKYDKMHGYIGGNKFYNSYLTNTKQNEVNLETIMKFIQPWVKKMGIIYWINVMRYVDYGWLEGLTYNITEKDIINYYRLTPDDVKEIKY